MKQRLFLIFGVFFISLILVGLVQAFTMGNVDGQWSRIEPDGENYGSATNDNWASGPPSGSTDFDDPEFIYTFWEPQSYYGLVIYDDWNQVRYGIPAVTDGGFADQSGFGFDGVNVVNDQLHFDTAEPFLFGKFCHFNNPIDPPDDPLEWVDLYFHVENIQCDQTADDLSPDPTGILDFTYRFTLDETPNSPEGSDCEWGGYAFCPYTIGSDTRCPYETGVNSLGCADKVGISALPITNSFACYYDGVAKHYAVSILGLIPLTNPEDPCPANPAGDFSHALISGEEADNCACFYGSITEIGVTAVEFISFTASASQEGIILEWQTGMEVDTLGFNLLRSSSRDGEKIQINQEFIPSNIFPGSLLGASYRYLDTGSDLNLVQFPKDTEVYYWLEEMDIFKRSELHGPVIAIFTGN